MRAFMSSKRALAEYKAAWSPAACGSEYAAAEEWMREADHEARRILAETEPWPGYHLGLGPYPVISRPIAQAALADALATFVAK